MKKVLKNTVIAFSGLIVYSALCIVTSVFIDNIYLARIISGLVFIILGRMYYATVLKEKKCFYDINHKFLIIAISAVILYCFVSLFTSNLILASVNDANYLRQAAETVELSKDMKILSLILSVLLMPIVEELIYRGFLYKRLSEYNKLVAAIISSVIFAVNHGTIVHLYAAFFGGLLFCIIYDKLQSIKYNIAAHIFFNAFTLIISCISYPSFMRTIWFAVVLNMLMLLVFVILFKTQGVKTIPIRQLTEKQKYEKAETARIVNEVLAEYKHKH